MAYQRLSDLPFPIGESISFGEITVVQLDIPERKVMNENVFGVRSDGYVLWQIPPLPTVYAYAATESSSYVGVSRRRDDVVVAVNWSGKSVDLSVWDGRVLGTTWGK